jgi:uncharacterized membrane protein
MSIRQDAAVVVAMIVLVLILWFVLKDVAMDVLDQALILKGRLFSER